MRKINDLDGEFTDAERLEFAKMLIKLFDHWALSLAQQAACLGLSEQTRSTLNRYRQENKPLAKNRDLHDRVRHLLGIHKALRILFPENRDYAYQWITRRNRYFDNFAPIEIIERQGFEGLLRVRYYLEKQLVS